MEKKRKKIIPPIVTPVQDLNPVLPVDETLTINGETYAGAAGDFINLSLLGEGVRGTVYKCRHRPSNCILAVKRIRCPMDEDDRKPIFRELAVCKQAADCPYMVSYYGAFFGEGDVWLCMEVMDVSLDKFYRVLANEDRRIPENVLRKIAIDVVNALEYLHCEMHVIHRDVKPSNILLNRAGDIKLCDYSISGYLVNSLALSMGVGFYPYMAPERIKPDQDSPGYNVKSDVWSLGITLIELATGKHPYSEWTTVFLQMQEVIEGESPQLPADQFSEDFHDFVNCCLKKDVVERHSYARLLKHPFIAKETPETDEVQSFVKGSLREFAKEFGLDISAES